MENLFKRKLGLIFVSLGILAVFLTVFRFTTTPKVWVDEGVFTEAARNLEQNGVIGIQEEPGKIFELKGWILSTSYPVIFPVALSLKLFGIGLWQARLSMVIYLLLFILVSFLFIRKKYGDYVAVLTTLLLLSFSPIYGNGIPVQGEVPGLFFLMLGSYFLLLLENSGFTDKKFAILSGFAFGLCCATKPVFLTFVPIAILVSFLFIKKNQNKKIILYFALSMALPLLFWFYIHFPTLKLISGMISSYLYLAGDHNSGVSTLSIVLHNLIRFFTESTPILFSFCSMFVLVSFYFRFFKEKDSKLTMSELVLFLFILLNWLGYLKGTGWYRYFFPAHVILYVLFVGSIMSLSSVFNNVIVKRVLIVIPICLVLFQFYYLVFLSDTSFVVYRTRNIELSDVLSKIPSDKKVLFYNSIETIVFLKSSNYSQYLEMDDFLIAGDKSSLSKAGADYILTDKSQHGNVALSCYAERPLSQYFFLEKTSKCKK